MNDFQQRRHNYKDADDPFGCPKTNSSSTSFLTDADHSFQTTGESVLENMMMDQRRRPSNNTSSHSKSSNGIGALSNGSLFEGKQSAPTQTQTTTTFSDFNQSNSNRNIRRMNIMDRLRRLTFPTNSMELMESMDGTSGGGGGNGGVTTTAATNSSPAFTDSTTTTTTTTISDDDGDHQLPLNLITPRATPIPQIPRSSSDFPRHDLRTNPNLPGSDDNDNGGNGLGISAAAGIGLGQSGLFLRNGTSLENVIPLTSINDRVRRIEELNDPTHLNSYISVGNNDKEYPVEVDIKDCNVLDGYLCGYLTIHNLTAEYKSLTTFFDAEIIGSGGNRFLTRKWSADISIDRCHWNRFDYFRERFGDLYLDGEDWGDDTGGGGGNIIDGYDNNIHRSRLQQQHYQIQNQNHLQLQMPQSPDLFRDSVIFMRWKERFLVPDYRVDNIPGASYAGFYYMAYDKSSNNLEGYYYHKDANQIAQENGTTVEIQKLDLVHKTRMTSSFYEFM